jgi:sugar phosphate isomerase/epimerase
MTPDPAPKPVATHIHSFSLRHHFRAPQHVAGGWDVFRYMAQAAAAGFDGVDVSANGPGYRDLGGTDPAHFARVAEAREAHGLFLALDTSGVDRETLSRMLAVAAACGAETLRTYTRHRGGPAEMIARTVADLRAIAPEAEDHGVTIVLENHEDFRGTAIAEILAAVDSPRVRALYDYGNSQPVREDPFDALEATAPFVACCHVKDHVLTPAPGGRPVVQGVAIGRGTLPVADLTARLHARGLRRFCFESVWGYATPLQGDGPPPAGPCFAQREGAFLLSDPLPPAEAVAREAAAVRDGLAWFRAMLRDGGYACRLTEPGRPCVTAPA